MKIVKGKKEIIHTDTFQSRIIHTKLSSNMLPFYARSSKFFFFLQKFGEDYSLRSEINFIINRYFIIITPQEVARYKNRVDLHKYILNKLLSA